MTQETNDYEAYPPPPPTQAKNNSLNYAIFALGAILLIIGIYLSTFTTVEIINQPYDAGTILGTIMIPHPIQVQPYMFPGIFSIVIALVLISYALITIGQK